MRTLRAILPALVVIAVACLRGAPQSWPRSPSERAMSAIDLDMPRLTIGSSYAVTDPPRTVDELADRIDAIRQRERITGISIALVDRNGVQWIGGLGLRDRTTREPVDADTAFRVGSLSKSIIALGVMRLVDQGKLDVDRPLREILPDLAIENPWEAEAPVTLAQCLEHTAGFDDLRFNEIFAPDDTMTVREALALNPRSRIIRWKPGTQHVYSNVAFTIAALAIEKAAGEPFDEYLRREVLAPIGITDADFKRTPTLEAHLATGYMNFDEPVVFRPFAHRPPGALLASAKDLAKLVHFWIVRGEGYPSIVSPEGLARIETAGTWPYPKVDAQYGMANYTDIYHPVIGRGHDGGMPGFHSSYRYFPSLGVGYTMLLNANYTFRGYVQIRALLFAYLTQGRTFEPPPVALAAQPPSASFFVPIPPGRGLFGFMDQIWGGIRVTPIDNGELDVSNMMGEQVRLLPTADGAYRTDFESGSSTRFTTRADGTPLMIQGWHVTQAGSEWQTRMRNAAFRLAVSMLVLAPLWALLELTLAFLFGRRILPRSLLLWPSLAGICCFAMPRFLEAAFFAGVIGTVHPLTVGLCASTLLLAFASVATLVSSIRWLRRPDRPPLVAMIVPIAFGLAFSAFSLFLALNGVIGLRTWSW